MVLVLLFNAIKDFVLMFTAEGFYTDICDTIRSSKYNINVKKLL